MSEADGGVPPVPEAIADAAPSRKLVVWAFLLSDADRLTQEGLRELTGLSLSAVSHSLRDLRDAGLVEKHPDPNNPVGHHYELQITRS
jgi:DNA-binding HxlR family transcriptional regulator